MVERKGPSRDAEKLGYYFGLEKKKKKTNVVSGGDEGGGCQGGEKD